MLRPQLPASAYRQICDCVTQVRRHLGAIRDLTVNALELSRAVRQAGLHDGLIGQICEDWDGQRKAQASSVTYPAMRALLRAAASTLRQSSLGPDVGTLKKGLRRLYRRAGASARIALADPTDRRLHRCRRRTQHLRFALDFAAAHLAHGGRRLRRRAKRLSDLLGQCRDLARLEKALKDVAIPGRYKRSLQATVAHLRADSLTKSLRRVRRTYARERRRFRSLREVADQQNTPAKSPLDGDSR